MISVVRLAAVFCLFATGCLTSVSAQQWRLIFPQQAYTVRINHLDPHKLYVGNESNTIYRSNDAGRSWELVEVNTIGGGSAVSSLLVSSKDTSVIFAAGFLMNGIRRSDDGGATFQEVLADPSFLRQWFISEAVIENPQDASILYAARGSSLNTIYKSTDTGISWDSIATIPTTVTTRLCTISSRYDSTDILFCGCAGGIITRSLDAGLTWQRVEVLPGRMSISPDAEIPKIIFSKADARVGYAVVTIGSESAVAGNGGLLRSSNGGATWDRIAFPDTSLWAVETRVVNGNEELFVGGFRTSNRQTIIKGDSLVFRSTNGGTDWVRYQNTPWNTTQDGDTIRNVWMLRNDAVGNRMYMATQVGLYVLDETTSVEEQSTSSLYVHFKDNEVVVIDHAIDQNDRRWSVYSMSGRKIISGDIAIGVEHRLPVGDLSSGSYLLVWGSGLSFRTALFVVNR